MAEDTELLADMPSKDRPEYVGHLMLPISLLFIFLNKKWSAIRWGIDSDSQEKERAKK